MLALNDGVMMALAASALLALAVGPLGCFVVWRRMAYFGDSLAHSSLIGIALGAVLGLSDTLATFLVCSLFALAMLGLMRWQLLSTDTLLGILAHSALALGVIGMVVAGEEPDHLHDELFGQILTLEPSGLLSMAAVIAVVVALLYRFWPALVLLSLNEDLARAEGVRRFPMQALMMLAMTAVVAVSITMVGILLITSLLIIPAATARLISRSPVQMARAAIVLALAALWGGVALSLSMGWPSGPAVVAVSAGLFVLVLPLSR